MIVVGEGVRMSSCPKERSRLGRTKTGGAFRAIPFVSSDLGVLLYRPAPLETGL